MCCRLGRDAEGDTGPGPSVDASTVDVHGMLFKFIMLCLPHIVRGDHERECICSHITTNPKHTSHPPR